MKESSENMKGESDPIACPEKEPSTVAPKLLDTRKLLCPLPVIRLQQTIQTLAKGAQLTILASDRGVLYDIPAWCRIHGHQVINIQETTEGICIDVCKGT